MTALAARRIWTRQTWTDCEGRRLVAVLRQVAGEHGWESSVSGFDYPPADHRGIVALRFTRPIPGGVRFVECLIGSRGGMRGSVAGFESYASSSRPIDFHLAVRALKDES